MDTDLLATRLAKRLRLPIAAVGIGSVFLAAANLFLQAVDDRLIAIAAMAVGVAAAGMFLTAVADTRFKRAVSVMNAERRIQFRQKGHLARLTGSGLPLGDRLLVTVSVPVLALLLIAGNYFHRLPATLLLFAALVLVGVAQIGLMVRGQPADHWSDPLA